MQPHIYSLSPKAASLEELIQKARTFVAAAKAPATLKAYRNDWRDFELWCREHQLPSLPSTPETVALYIADRASTLASGTITRRLTSITKAHQAAGFTDSPATTRHFVVGETLKGIRRVIGTAHHGKAPLLSADVRRIVAARREDLLGLRDAALVLVGFAGGFRRSELAGIEICDLKFSADGVVVTVRKSKTDQEGAGREVGLPFGASHDTCPVRALRLWLDSAGIREGAVFRSVGRYGHVSGHGLHSDSIGKLLKRAAGRAGLKVEELGAIRSGLLRHPGRHERRARVHHHAADGSQDHCDAAALYPVGRDFSRERRRRPRNLNTPPTPGKNHFPELEPSFQSVAAVSAGIYVYSCARCSRRRY
jgi:integrase